jgi:hypothetical protein
MYILIYHPDLQHCTDHLEGTNDDNQQEVSLDKNITITESEASYKLTFHVNKSGKELCVMMDKMITEK